MKYFAKVGEVERAYSFERRDGVLWVETEAGERFPCDVSLVGDGAVFSMIVDGRSYDCLVQHEGGDSVVQVAGRRVRVSVQDERERAAGAVAGARVDGPRAIEAAMPGVVVDISVAVGDVVTGGQTLVVLEAMKMQNPIQADGDGRVLRIAVDVGAAVAGGAVLVELGPVDGDGA